MVTSTSYGSLSANNLLPVSSSAGAGDGSLTASGTVGYDAFGNMIVSTDALGNQTHYSYDADRELVETISPDPDGGGPLKPRASRTTYNADGTVAQVDVGTDTGSNFASLQTVATQYDAALRKIQTTASAGGTTYTVVQYAYDGTGRLQCTAQRMNPSAFGSLPGACSLGTAGSYGNDRIGYTHYDAAGRTDYVTTAYGAPEAATEHVSYTTNGKTASVTDANGNVTAYGYDGFDRPLTTTYADGSYEQLGYDANGNATSKRLRDGNSLNYAYDALNRVISDNQSHNYTYDNVGHLVSANDTNNAYENFAWDSLGRKTSESAAYGGMATMQYDAAGRRTRLTWADGFFVTYDYDMLGEMTAIHENGGTVLASFGYDDLGRRVSLSRTNGTSTSYGYDSASRLTGLSLNGGSSNSYTFGYNPAGQITTRTSSNDAYAWTGAVNANRSYSVNGLNQYTASGSVTPTYDGRGNLTSAGSTTYTYDLYNRLTNFSGGYIYRNALGQWLDVNTEQQWMVHDDDRTIEEYGYDGTVHRRYVYGPGADEPLVWYEGSGTSDRRFLAADERGSVVSVTDNGGNTVGINSYDEYGIPGANNIGRFQYTGQRWISALGMYDYKARMYSPTLGRFLQTDPIGYGDGMNWYNYVGSDPINGIDPSGLQDCQTREPDSRNQEPICPPDILAQGGAGAGRPVVSGDGPPTLFHDSIGTYGYDISGQIVYTSFSLDSFGAQSTGSLGFNGVLGVPSPQSIVSRVKSFLCGAPQPSGGGGVDAYAGVGGSISGAGSFNPRNGQISLGFDLGVGVGLGGGGRYSVGKAFGVGSPSAEAAPIAGAGVNLNATGVAGPVGATGSYQLIGSNPGDWSAAYTGGAEVSGNANISAHVQFNLPALYSLGCPK